MTWIAEAAQALEQGPRISPSCQSHPDGHYYASIPVNYPVVGPTRLWGFDAAAYSDTPDYCMGDDDVSRTLTRYAQWEPVETRRFAEILQWTPGVVLDFGAQVGWYSILAAKLGHDVLAVEAVTEHCQLIRRNAAANGLSKRITIAQTWLDEGTPYLPDGQDIAMVKIDVEGNDRHAWRAIRGLAFDGLVANIMCEISPCFNDSYVGLVMDIMNSGFDAQVMNPLQPFDADQIEEVVNQAPQVEMLFRRILHA